MCSHIETHKQRHNHKSHKRCEHAETGPMIHGCYSNMWFFLMLNNQEYLLPLPHFLDYSYCFVYPILSLVLFNYEFLYVDIHLDIHMHSKKLSDKNSGI